MPMDRSKLHTRYFTPELQVRQAENDTEEMWVEGYAVRFDSPTVLFEYGGVEYREQICTGAFDGCAMSDVILNYNHQGRVFARTRNHTLQLTVDELGLFIRARLDGTEEGRRLYEEIKGGYVDRMSFAFTVREESYDSANRQWNVRRIKRLFDVSAVDFPAYEDTSISARRAAILEADAQERRRAAEAALQREKLRLKLKLTM